MPCFDIQLSFLQLIIYKFTNCASVSVGMQYIQKNELIFRAAVFKSLNDDCPHNFVKYIGHIIGDGTYCMETGLLRTLLHC